jgi:hypothetical protein
MSLMLPKIEADKKTGARQMVYWWYLEIGLTYTLFLYYGVITYSRQNIGQVRLWR